MKKFFILTLFLVGGCYYDGVDRSQDASPEASVPRNDENTDGGICCQITYNFTNEPFWNDRLYTCVHPDVPRDPFNPPWLCNVTYDGYCGEDSGLDCMVCTDPTCVVGMRCRDVNGTGTVIPCK